MGEAKFKDLWIKDQSKWVHADYISVLIVDIYETVPGSSPPAMKTLFPYEIYTVQPLKQFSKLPETNTCQYGTQACILKLAFSGIRC